MDYHEYKAQCVKDFVAAILSTGGPVTETIIEATAYKVIVHQSEKIADYIIEKMKQEDPDLQNSQNIL
jgi:hypothetical protein